MSARRLPRPVRARNLIWRASRRRNTDGSKLTFRGLPCPNIYTGGHEFHSKLEFNSRRGLERTAETLVHLAAIFAARGAPATSK